MSVLADSNVLIFSVQEGHARQEECIRAIETVFANGEPVFVFLQNIAEFWNVCTRPLDKNGLGFSPEQTERALNRLYAILTVRHDTEQVYARGAGDHPETSGKRFAGS